MADDKGGGSGFTGVIIGALLVAMLGLGYFAYGGFGGKDERAEIQITPPEGSG